MKGPPCRRSAAFLLALAAAVAFPARAGVPLRDTAGLPMHWDLEIDQPNLIDGRITYFVDPLTSQEEPPGDTTEQVAIMQAAAAWEGSPGSRVRFRDDPSRPAYDRKAGDRVNYFGWKQFVLSPFTMASTFTTSSDGVITDADIIFNDTVKSVKWATETPGLPGYADVQAVATHELGHLIGLDHTPVATATMAAVQPMGSISARYLSPDDAGAVLEAYPNQVNPTVGTIIGTLRTGRHRTVPGIPVFALDARTGEVAGSAFSGSDGYYRIYGLPPGPYRVAAAPLASLVPYSQWWAKAPTRLLPAFLEEDTPDGGRAPATVFVRAGFPEVGKDFRIGRFTTRAGGEPDDGPDLAREIRIGGGAVGIFDRPLDEDWFWVTSDGTNAFDVRVASWTLGADADPEVAVLAEDGATVMASSIDLRPPTDDAFAYGPAGIDRDATIRDFVPPAHASYLVRVRAQPLSGSGGPGSFYLLQVVPSAGVPDPHRTTAALVPASTRVPGGPPVTLVAIPRNFVGDPVGPGASVTMGRSDGGDPVVLADRGDGTYAGPVDLPAVAGDITFSLAVVAPRGRATVAEAAVLSVAGPPDAAVTAFEVSPRRVEADGLSVATFRYVPKDSAGRPLGPGLAPVFGFDGPPAGVLGPVVDLGDGTYEAEIVAPAAPASARVSVTVGGQPTGASRLVGFGWDLPLVAADLGAEVQEVLGKPGLSKGESALFDSARKALNSVLASYYAMHEPETAVAAAKAYSILAAAGKSPRFSSGGPASREILEALRRRAHAALDLVVFPIPDPPGEKLLASAKAILGNADAAYAAANRGLAARLFAAAVRRAGPLL